MELYLPMVGGLLIGGLVGAALMYGTLRALSGTKPSFKDLVRGASFAAPIIVVHAISDAPFAASMLLLDGDPPQSTMLAVMIIAIGGYFLTTIWFAAAPAVIAEGLGILSALRRSARLTTGKRWPVFGLVLLDIIFFGGLELVLATFAESGPSSADTVASALTDSIISDVVTASSTVFLAVSGTIAYCTLRAAKEGTSVQEVARVFD